MFTRDNNISAESVEIASCSNGHVQKLTNISHQDGHMIENTCNAILTHVIPPSFPLNDAHYQVVLNNG